MKTFAVSLVALAAALSTSAGAADLSAYRGQTIDLGALNGIAYYTVEEKGYRVVATLADTESKAVRFEAVLAPGQSVVLSAAANAGKAPARVEIRRTEDRVSVTARPLTN